MGYTISKEFHFSASHVLNGLPEGHQCGRLHGHNYIVVVELAGSHLDDTGFILDFGDLAPVKKMIDNELDHRHLNDVIEWQTSAENIARYIWRRTQELIPEIYARGLTLTIRISETPKSWAAYTL